jgi:hypothetical protein
MNGNRAEEAPVQPALWQRRSPDFSGYKEVLPPLVVGMVWKECRLAINPAWGKSRTS